MVAGFEAPGFPSERDGKRQIYLIHPLGGEAQQLTSEENGVESMEWAPDGNAIAFTSTGPDAKAKKDRKERYGDFDMIGGDYAMMRLWRVKTPAEIPADPKQRPQAEALTEGDNSMSPTSPGRPIPSSLRSARSATPISVLRAPRRSILRFVRQACEKAAGFERPQHAAALVAGRTPDRVSLPRMATRSTSTRTRTSPLFRLPAGSLGL